MRTSRISGFPRSPTADLGSRSASEKNSRGRVLVVTQAITLAGVSKYFDAAKPVLDNIDFVVEQGQFICVVGVSGCGKSTLLNLIAGLESTTVGTVEVPSGRASVMFQDPSLMPWLTARGNVELALRLRGVGRKERADEAQRLLALVNLADAGDKLPHQLSGGMKQRVALARALAQDREVLLMDEPFAALDAVTRDLLHDELERVWRETGRTIVFVTHNVREAARLGDRVVLMTARGGKIAREWDIDVQRPRLIESPEVSTIAGSVSGALRAELAKVTNV